MVSVSESGIKEAHFNIKPTFAQAGLVCKIPQIKRKPGQTCDDYEYCVDMTIMPHTSCCHKDGGHLDKFDRIYALHKLLSDARHPIPRQQLLQQLECSRSTFMRLANVLRDYLGAPLNYNKERNGWHYDQQGEHPFELPGLWFNAHELQALTVIHQFLRDLNPGLLEEQLRPFQKRINQMLDNQQLGHGNLPDKLRILGMGVRSGGQAFQTIAEAVLQNKQIAIEYHARGTDENSQRIVSPQRLIHYRDNWYLDGWCHKRNALRSFSVDRINKPSIINQPAQHIKEQQLQQHFAQAYGIFSGQAKHTAVLKFNAYRARWVSEERWHPKQQGRFLDDGSYELKIPYGKPQELIMDILRYGPDVEVVGPMDLRMAVQQRLEKALVNYEK